MICALKFKHEIQSNVDVPKAVFSYWPLIENKKYCGVMANVSLTFRHHLHSSGLINGATLCFPKGHIYNGDVKNMSVTLLDENNPLSTSYTGLYQKEDKTATLLKYDGVDNVFVDYLATLQVFSSKHNSLDYLTIQFSKPIPPGLSIAVRFIYFTKDMFDVGKDHSMHFAHTFFDERIVAKVIGGTNLRKMQIPFLTNYDSFGNGGFDIFYYMPLELRGEYFDIDPIRRLRPSYNYIGEKTNEPFKKHSWQAKRLLNVHHDDPVLFGLGDRLIISGVFTFREIMKEVMLMGDITNKDGIIIVGSNVNDSTISAGITNDEYVNQLSKLSSLILELELELKKSDKLDDEQILLLQSFIQTIKTQKDSKNKKLVLICLEGLYEASKNLGAIAPNVINLIGKIKDLFQ